MGVIKFITPEKVGEVVQACKEAEICGLDTETTALHPRHGKIRLIQVAVGEVVYILDCFRYSPLLLSPIFDGTIHFIGHNLAFDLRFLWSVGLILPHGKNIFDSMIAGQLLDAGILPRKPHDLASMLTEYCDIEMDKTYQTSDWSQDQLSMEQFQYAAKDAASLIPLYHELVAAIGHAKLERTMRLEMRALPGMVWMTLQGIQLDVDGWKKLAYENAQKVENLEQALADETESQDLFGYSLINWRSPTQVTRAFNTRFIEQGRTYKVRRHLPCNEPRCKMYGQMYEYEYTEGQETWTESVPVCTYHSSYEEVDEPFTIESTGSRVLAQLAADGDALAGLLLKYRKTIKSRDTYGLGFLDKYLWHDDRIYPEYHQLGAGATGRMSSSNPNGQNIPHSFDFRSLFIPGPGNRFALADYSQIELRITVQISKDPAGWDAYVRKNEDLHTATAQLILGSSSKEARQVAKSLNFGLIFGAGADTLRLYAQSAYNIILSPEEAVRLRNKWRNIYAGIVSWQKLAGNGSHTTYTLGGRRRTRVFKFTEKLNSPVQGTAIDGLKAAIALCYERRHEINSAAVPVAYVHDEILFQVPEHAAQDTSLWIQRQMEEGMKYFVKEVPCPAEPKTLDNWGEK